MSRTRPKRKDLIEWFNLDEPVVPVVPVMQLDPGYYAFGPRTGAHGGARVAVGPFNNVGQLADYLDEVEGPCEGEGIGIVLCGRIVAWRDVVPTYSWPPALDMIPEHLVG